MNKKGLSAARHGFTLIELLIVIAIIGILSVALVPTGMSALKKARDGSRVSNMASIKTAMQQYVLDKTGCPADAAALDAYFDSGKTPADPKNSDPYTYVIGTSTTTATNKSVYCYALAELEYTTGKQGNFGPLYVTGTTTKCKDLIGATALTSDQIAALAFTADYKCHVVYIQK